MKCRPGRQPFSRRPFFSGVLLLSSHWVGCSPGSSDLVFERGSDAGQNSDSGVVAQPVSLVLGTGEADFDKLLNGSTVSLIAGPQGGFHFSLSLRVYRLDVERLLMRATTQWSGVPGTVVPDGNPPRDVRIRLRPQVDEQGQPVLQLLRWTAFVYEPTCADGRQLDIVVQLRLQAEDDYLAVEPLAQASAQIVLALEERYRSQDCD